MTQKINNVIFCVLSVMLLAAVLSGCGAVIDPDSESQLDNSQTGSSSLSESQDVESQLPPVMFMKYVDYSEEFPDEEDAPDNMVSFFANDGSHYVSIDGTLSAMSPGTVAEEFEKGTLQEHIELHTQCEPDELEEEYLRVSSVIKSGDFQIIDPAEAPAVQATKINWYGIYYDENGEIQCRLIHKTDMVEHTSDNDDLNEVYEWLLEHEKQNALATD